VCCDGPDRLAAAVVELLSDSSLLARMGAAARAWAVEQFDWAALSKQAAHLFALNAPRTTPTHSQESIVA
jgi:glycosyltransferase involved in cell wall biosynthesis